MQATGQAAAASGPRITAVARVPVRPARYFGLARKQMSPGPARSSAAKRPMTASPSPLSSPPRRATICASVTATSGRLFAGFRQRLDHLFGDVDAGARIDRFLEDDVELLGLGDLLDGLVGSFQHRRQFLVLALVEILAELPLLALEITVEIVEFAVLGLALRLGHRQSVLVEVFLHALQLLGDALHVLVTLLEFLFDLLLGLHRRRGVPEDPLGIDESDLGFGLRERRSRQQDGGEQRKKSGFQFSLPARCKAEIRTRYPSGTGDAAPYRRAFS